MIVGRQAAWITDISARIIFVIDGARLDELPISIVGHDLAMRPGSEELWVTPWSSDRVVVIDTTARKEVAGFRVGGARSHKHPAFTEDGSEAWITDPRSGSLFVVDTRTRKVVESIGLGGRPHHLRMKAGKAYVAVGPQDLVVVDVRTRSVVGRLPVGSEIHDVALGPAK